MTTGTSEWIILVPGLGPGGAEMLPLLYRLRRRGYKVRLFWHFPWIDTLEHKAIALQRFISTPPTHARLHLVGHSLGGLIILRMLQDYIPQSLRRIVTMGTPHLGSTAVNRVNKHPFGHLLVGPALSEACDAEPLSIPTHCELGTLAGKRALRKLATFLGHRRANDTMVAEAETRHPNAVDHVLLSASHAGMLVSPEVDRQIVHFLANGRFRHVRQSE